MNDLSERPVLHGRFEAPATFLGVVMDPTGDGGPAAWAARVSRAASLDFTDIVTPPLSAFGADRTLAASLNEGHPAFAGAMLPQIIRRLASEARAHHTRLLLDVVIDRVAAGSAASDGPFVDAMAAGYMDPRRPSPPVQAAVARLATAEDADALAAFWAGWLKRWRDCGASGFRLLGLDRLPAEHLPRLLSTLRRLVPGATLLAWTPGVAWPALAQLTPGSVDLVASSLQWWDGKADWMWRELELLRAISPVIGTLADAGGEAQGLLAAAMGGVLMDGLPDELPASVAGLQARTAGAAGLTLLSAPGDPVLAMLRTDTMDPRAATQATLVVTNQSPEAQRVDPGAWLPRVGGAFGPFGQDGGEVIEPGRVVLVPAHGGLVFTATHVVPPAHTAVRRVEARAGAASPRIAIESVTPSVDEGRFPVKRTVGEAVPVMADVICDGHDQLAVVLRWRGPGDADWREQRMRLLGNDRWTADLPLTRLGLTHFTVIAWRDAFATYTDELSKKRRAGVPIKLELQEGGALVRTASQHATGVIRTALAGLAERLTQAAPDTQADLLLSTEVAGWMASADPRPFRVELERTVPMRAERTAAGFASWYEVFPRSLSDDPARHGTFRDVERHLPRIQAMGFDVLYFPPIHPIGRTNRKGPNNSLKAGPGDPGSPYAVGAPEGGHDALHPELGTLDDFQHLRAACSEHGLELAIDFAIQCSPDHPWLKDHKDWFNWRPDGSLRYAENPPKKYEDIVNVDFYAPGAVPDLWMALCDVVLFWAGQGVRLFRVDNPHTKPLPFWQWMIAEVQDRYPDTVFLAEAFTRPKVMYRLAKVGFGQSYTYFTWRTTKAEFQDYLTELTTTAPRDFFRPHFLVNTPDINPLYLHDAGRSGYLVRAALATTLSGLWGVYNGFELCEGRPVAPGKEEYLDSEKYQVRAWDWDRPGNIVPEITQLNALRRANPALQTHLGVTFLPSDNPQVLYFEKATADRSNVILVAISMDVSAAQSSAIEAPLWRYPTPLPAALTVEDLLTDASTTWRGIPQRVTLTPDRPYAVWRIRPTL